MLGQRALATERSAGWRRAWARDTTSASPPETVRGERTLQPDLVLVREKQVVAIVTVAAQFEHGAEEVIESRASKLARYNLLAQRIRQSGYNVNLIALLLGALGRWNRLNWRILKAFGMDRRRGRAFAKRCCATALSWSRDIYIQHVYGQAEPAHEAPQGATEEAGQAERETIETGLTGECGNGLDPTEDEGRAADTAVMRCPYKILSAPGIAHAQDPLSLLEQHERYEFVKEASHTCTTRGNRAPEFDWVEGNLELIPAEGPGRRSAGRICRTCIGRWPTHALATHKRATP